MSRPFPDTFDDGRSPLTPLAGGPSNSISYQANVNRRKTKKWADAKPVSYGGDDWGDEYDDEYDAAPPPPEVPKPTGFRQPGQGVAGSTQPAGNYHDGRKPYGDLPTIPSQGADRSATLPPQLRRNSFGDDDERRAFSSGPTQFPPQAGHVAPQLHVQTQSNAGGFRGSGPQPMDTPPIQAPGAFPETPYSIAESQRSYMGEQQQQPYQQPYQQSYPISPVNARGIPLHGAYGRNASPVSAGRSGSPGTFAPRKSSLSQSSIPDVSDYQTHSRERSQEPTMKPWPGPGVASPGGTSAPATGKALPFVRPADIYKRLEEERTKERQSMESGRPSMDSIMGNREREMSPPAAPSSSAIPPPTDQYTRGRSGSGSDNYADSGRRLAPSLEPVAERKSEYSFMDASTRSPEVAQALEEIKRSENPPQQHGKPSLTMEAPQISYNSSSQKAEDSEHDSSFEQETRRRFSTSPKLPDLNRLSGFGFDMWGSKPSEPAPEPIRPPVAPVQPEAKIEEPVLHKTPSIGFNSVVHQAFDRNDSFSDARDPQRTNSDTSVGTAGISPINSRDAFGHQDSTPMITEESEPNSRRGSGITVTKQEARPGTPDKQIPFHLGHRRDLSAPISESSRDNSPARTPVVQRSAVVGPGVQVHVANESESSPTADEEKQIEEAARYERYPRPPIPGGWTSYATTGGESVHKSDEPNVNAPADTSKIAPYTAAIIASNPLPDEFSPAIASRMDEVRPPSSGMAPVVQPPAADEHSPKTTAPDASSPPLAKGMDAVALPTPDPHMGPIGNPYSAVPLDPRIDSSRNQPETPMSTKSADTITGLQPPAIHEPGVSPGSSVGPTPPPKDTPRMPGFGDSDYFAPPVPLKPKTAEEVAAAEGLLPPTRPAMMPTLSTNTSPYDDENDKLRKEIVKSLSPRQSLSGPSQSQAPHQSGQNMLGVGSPGAPRESMYLPSEYDSYWEATEEKGHSNQQQAAPVTAQDDVTVNVTAASPGSENAVTPPIPPLNPKRMSRTSMGSIHGASGRRYSWDQGQERSVSQQRGDTSAPAIAVVPSSDSRQEPKPWSPTVAGNGSAKGKLPVDLQRADSASPAPLSIRSAKTDKTSEVSSDKPSNDEPQGLLEKAAAVGAAAAATVAATAASVLPLGSSSPHDPKGPNSNKDLPSLEGVLIDEDARVYDKALSAEVSPVSAMTSNHDVIPPLMNVVPPPNAEEPQMSQSGAMLPSPLNISRPATAVSAHSHSSRPMNAAQQAPPMHFREIMVMPLPQQRIEAYNRTRAQYAQMDSGLANWLAAQTGGVPQTPPQLGQNSNSPRTGSFAQGDASPYHQPYANPSASSVPLNNIGTPQRQSTLSAMGLGTQGNFGSGRQSQAQQNAQQAAHQAKEKSKEFLHSAGVFGGAMGKKSKGLFKKSTSRWLGGGGDKETPPSTPSKDENYTPSVRSASFSTQTPQQREPSPRAPYPSLTPVEGTKPTPTKRRTSWLPHFGSHSGRPGSRGDQLEGERNAPRRAFSHDVSSFLHGTHHSRASFSHDERPARPTFGHQHSASFGTLLSSPQGSHTRQRSGSLPLPPGVVVDVREVSSIQSATPPPSGPGAPQIHLDLPSTQLRDDNWLSTSPAHTASPHLSAANSSQSPHPSSASRQHSQVPSLNSEQKLEKEEARDVYDKELPSLEKVQDDHEHTGVRPPVPIGKFQPTWDPFNATPIQEEREGDEYSFGRKSASLTRITPPASGPGAGAAGAVIKGAAGVALATGAATTADVIKEQVVERRKEVGDDDIYDASPGLPPPRHDQHVLPAALAAGSATTSAAITEQVQLQHDSVTRRDEEWTLVEHHDAPLQSQEPGYFPRNTRLDLEPSRFSSRGHSRGISEVSAVSAMTVSPGEIVDAEEMRMEQQMSPPRLRESLLALETEELAPPRPVFVVGGGQGEGVETPSMQGVPGAFPATPGASEAPALVGEVPIKEVQRPEQQENQAAIVVPSGPDDGNNGEQDRYLATLQGIRNEAERIGQVVDQSQQGIAVSREPEVRQRTYEEERLQRPMDGNDAPEQRADGWQAVRTRRDSLRAALRGGELKTEVKPREEAEEEEAESEVDSNGVRVPNQHSSLGLQISREPEPRQRDENERVRAARTPSPVSPVSETTPTAAGAHVQFSDSTPLQKERLREAEKEEEANIRHLISTGQHVQPDDAMRPTRVTGAYSMGMAESREPESRQRERRDSVELARARSRSRVRRLVEEEEDGEEETEAPGHVHFALAKKTEEERKKAAADEWLAGVRVEEEKLKKQVEERAAASAKQAPAPGAGSEGVALGMAVSREPMSQQREPESKPKSLAQDVMAVVPKVVERAGVPGVFKTTNVERDTPKETLLSQAVAQPQVQPLAQIQPHRGIQVPLGLQQAARRSSPARPEGTESSPPPVQGIEQRSIVPIELQQAARSASGFFPSLSVKKHRTSSSKDLADDGERNPESPSTTTGSSFAIPPIRRTSTFGFGVVTKAKPATNRFSIEDDETGDESPHIVSPMSTTSISDSALPEAPKLHREEAVGNSPDMRQTMAEGPTEQRVAAGMGSLKRTSNVPRRASQQDRPRASNRFSYQKEGEQGETVGQREVLSRPPMAQQTSSDYDQPWTGQSTPTPLKAERPPADYISEAGPYVAGGGAAGAMGPGVMHRQQSQDQQHQPQGQPQAYQNVQQGRAVSSPLQQRQSYDAQQQGASHQQPHQRGPPGGALGPSPTQDRRLSQGPLGPNAAYPQRPSNDAQRQQQRPPSLGGVGTMPVQPPKILPQYTEAVNRPLSYSRSGARDGPVGIPPSSAERYPELFQSAQPADSPVESTFQPNTSGHVPLDGRQGKEGEVPGEYAVAEKGHLPRQQATEYQIPGVGPPADDPRNGSSGGRQSRRNSGFLKEIGGRLSRGSSRERRSGTDGHPALKAQTSVMDTTEDNLVISQVTDRRLESRDSDDISLDDDKLGLDEKKDKPQRRSLLGVFQQNRPGTTSTTGTAEQQQHEPVGDRPPSQVESMITHRPGSRTDLLTEPGVSPPPPPTQFAQFVPQQQQLQEQANVKEEKAKKKWSFFGKKKETGNKRDSGRENAGVILGTAGAGVLQQQQAQWVQPLGGGQQRFEQPMQMSGALPPQGQQQIRQSMQNPQQRFSQQQMVGGLAAQGQQPLLFDPRDPRFLQQQGAGGLQQQGQQPQQFDPRDPRFSQQVAGGLPPHGQHPQQFDPRDPRFQQQRQFDPRDPRFAQQQVAGGLSPQSQQPQRLDPRDPRSQQQQQFDPRDPRFQQQQVPQPQQPMPQPAEPAQSTSPTQPSQQPTQSIQQPPVNQSQAVQQRTPIPQPQPVRQPSTAFQAQEFVRPTQSPTSTSGSLPPVAQIPGAFPQQSTPKATPVIAPQPGPGPVPSQFTPRTGTPASSVQSGPPPLAADRVVTPRSPLGTAPVRQQPQQQVSQNQNQTAYQQASSQIGQPSYNQIRQGPQPSIGQHQAVAAQLAQGPPQLKKMNSDANRQLLQKRPSSAASSQKGKEPKEKKKSFFSGLLSSRRQSGIAEKDKKIGLVTALGTAGAAAQHQYQQQVGQQQRFSQQPMSAGAVPPGVQQFDPRDPRSQPWQQQQQPPQQFQQGPPQNRQLQGAPQPQPQQQYASPPIPGPYAHVRGDGQFAPMNQGPLVLTPQQQQELAFRRSQQQPPAFSDQRSYDEYMRQQQAMQAQQQGSYANLPPPPQGYYAPKQEQVPQQFRRASQEYVRDLNARSSQEYRRDSNSAAGGQQLNQTYTQQAAAQRPVPQQKEPIDVAIPAWKRAIRDTPNPTSPVRPDPSPPPVVGPQGDFAHLTAINPNASKTPHTPEPQGTSRPFLGLNDDRRNSNLSTEDLLARSPARAQFGQQAPYQLSLPGGDDEEMDSPHSRRSPPNVLSGTAPPPSQRESMRSAPSPLSQQHQRQGPSNVPLPETIFSPIVERGAGMRAEDLPPPPLPKWSAPPTPTGGVHNPQHGHAQHQQGVGLLHPGGQGYHGNQMLSPPGTSHGAPGVGRSNTVMSDVSMMTIDSSHHTPSPPHQPIANIQGQGGYHQQNPTSIGSPIGEPLSQVQSRDSAGFSPGLTPIDTPIVSNARSSRPIIAQSRTEPVVQRIHIPSDIRPTPLPQTRAQVPLPMPSAPVHAPAVPVPAQQQPQHMPVPANATGGYVIQDAGNARLAESTAHPDHSGLIYDNSREGLIVVEDANVRRVNNGSGREEDEGPVMSATSFPGDEWRPFGWDEGGFD